MQVSSTAVSKLHGVNPERRSRKAPTTAPGPAPRQFTTDTRLMAPGSKSGAPDRLILGKNTVAHLPASAFKPAGLQCCDDILRRGARLDGFPVVAP